MSVAIVLLETINFGQMKHSIRQLTIVIPESLDYNLSLMIFLIKRPIIWN